MSYKDDLIEKINALRPASNQHWMVGGQDAKDMSIIALEAIAMLRQKIGREYHPSLAGRLAPIENGIYKYFGKFRDTDSALFETSPQDNVWGFFKDLADAVEVPQGCVERIWLFAERGLEG